MTEIAVRYEYATDSQSTRDRIRPAHMEFLRHLDERGLIAASGRLHGDNRPGALIILRTTSTDDAEALLNDDPFWKAGVVAHRDVRVWEIVFGAVGQEEVN